MTTPRSLLFQPLFIEEMQLRNRIVLPPMCQYAAAGDGQVTAYHLAHYGVRALSGAALIIVEAATVEPDGRISGNDLGLWNDEQIPGMRRLAETIAGNGCVPGIQINHAGRKAWSGAVRTVAPSAIPFSQDSRVPDEMSPSEMQEILAAFVSATKRAVQAGFKVIELHAAHGYLLAEFISALSNRRTDEFGGNTINRMRFPLQVVDAVKQVLPKDVVLCVRLSAVEYVDEGLQMPETTAICRALEAHGVQLLHISTGGNAPVAPEVWPGYQLPFAHEVKEAVSIPVIGVGILQQPHLAEFALRAGYCDLVAIGRGYLHDPHWAVTAANQLGDTPAIPESMLKALRR